MPKRSAKDCVGQKDLQERWIYTRKGIYNVTRWKDFPAPVLVLGKRQERIWLLRDIEAFEQNTPELFERDIASAKTRHHAREKIEKPKSVRRHFNEPLLGRSELSERWGVRVSQVDSLSRRKSFPVPAIAVNGGRLRAWRLSDVEDYEAGRTGEFDWLRRREAQAQSRLKLLKTNNEGAPIATSKTDSTISNFAESQTGNETDGKVIPD